MSGMTFLLSDMFARGSVVALPLVLIGGLLAGMNPCCLALYPAAASCCAPGSANTQHPTRRVLAFVLGAASATSVLGLFAALAGRVMGQLGTPARYVIAAIPIVMGLHLVGVLRLPFSSVSSRLIPSNLLGPFGCGFLVSVAITPCSTPVLAAVLSYVAYKGSALYGRYIVVCLWNRSGDAALYCWHRGQHLDTPLGKIWLSKMGREYQWGRACLPRLVPCLEGMTGHKVFRSPLFNTEAYRCVWGSDPGQKRGPL